MPNAYASVGEIRASGGISRRSSEDSQESQSRRILELSEAVSREIDEWCHRYFYSRKSSLRMSSDSAIRMWVPEDLVSVDRLEEDTNWDGTYESLWLDTDLTLWPYNAEPMGELHRVRPYQRIDVSIRGGSGRRVFLAGTRRYRVVGTWGFCEVNKPVPIQVYCGEDDLVVQAVGDHGLSAGSTIYVEDEQIFITDVDVVSDRAQFFTDAGITDPGEETRISRFDVDRSVNGTQREAHTNIRPRVVQYPPAIREAAIMQTSRLYSRRISGFTSEVGFDQTGNQQQMVGLDRDVFDMLGSYRHRII